jgi:4-hydroxythreonine-4-phosphate dehydrogenase
MEREKIVIGITQGDINGIGYEVILKTLSESRVLDAFVPVIYGSPKVAAFHRKQLDIQGINLNIINSVEELNPKRINIINCSDDEIKVELGRSTVEAGKAAFAALEQATEDLKKGALDAIVTAPINKKNIQSADFHFPGHTEYLEEKFGTGTPSLMLLMNDVMRVAVVTGHIPVAEVSNAITKELIIEKLLVFNKSLKEDFMIVRPRIAVLGLNPHAGDEGVIGDEEQKTIIPALKEAEKQGVVCVGPYAPEKYFSFYSCTYLLIATLVSEACPIWAGLRQRCAPPWCNLAGRRTEGSVTARKTRKCAGCYCCSTRGQPGR